MKRQENAPEIFSFSDEEIEIPGNGLKFSPKAPSVDSAQHPSHTEHVSISWRRPWDDHITRGTVLSVHGQYTLAKAESGLYVALRAQEIIQESSP